MKKFKVAILTLGLFLFTADAFASAWSIMRPASSTLSATLAAKHSVTRADMDAIVSTIVKPLRARAGDAANSEQAFLEFLERPENVDLKNALSILNGRNIDELSPTELGQLNNRLGLIVGAYSIKKCSRCGISPVLKNTFNVTVIVPTNVSINAADLAGTAVNPGKLADSFKDIRTVKTSKTKMLREMKRAETDGDALAIMDFRKIAKAARCTISGKCGPDGKRVSNGLLTITGGDILGDGRALAIVSDMMAEGDEGIATLKVMGDEIDKVNADASLKTVDQRLKALCEAMSSKATDKQSKEAFEKLKNCPNYFPIFGKCKA